MAEQAQNAKLKEEGNALFAKKDYEAAVRKYTEALKLDDNNAVIYANRSACFYNRKKYSDALTDATRATGIDPSYAKGWSRAAAAHAALGDEHASARCWKKALDALPAANLTPAERKQKDQYESELKVMQKKVDKPVETLPNKDSVVLKAATVPWTRAQAIGSELVARGIQSSAYVIIGAYQDWASGIEVMSREQTVHLSTGTPIITRGTGALQGLASAILRDPRVFHISDPQWLNKYQDQVVTEARVFDAWTTAGPELVKAEALERLEDEGWRSLKLALGFTVRHWIFWGYMESHLRHRNDVGVEFVGNALEMIRWGQEVWKDVPKHKMGATFAPTFKRGVHAMYLDLYMGACLKDRARFPLKTLYDEAQALLEDCEDVAPHFNSSADVGFTLAFRRYPRGRAYYTIAWYYRKLVSEMPNPQDPRHQDSVRENSLKAGEAYIRAAKEFAIDDIYHVWYLICGLQNLWRCGAPLRLTMHIMKLIRERIPDMMRIWEHDPMTRDGLGAFKYTADVEKLFRAGLQQRKWTIDEALPPDGFVPKGFTVPPLAEDVVATIFQLL
ncbi:hypothetical protein EIP91_008411 [Steccherinum ochraceum]|uniref:Uncharacterized protein n=1 Tax=Steccherinum ochraceum TaxID=92696 RepID=A0A4R0RGK0_9APHY|nr:hypothetical protein EIP91_008411 [Steccherinum ochraceum]